MGTRGKMSRNSQTITPNIPIMDIFWVLSIFCPLSNMNIFHGFLGLKIKMRIYPQPIHAFNLQIEQNYDAGQRTTS